MGYHGQDIDPLDMLKKQLISQHLSSVRDSDLAVRLRRAAEDAASMAWVTTYPLLVLPELLREKAAEAVRHYQHQARIRPPGVGLAA